MNNPFSVNGVKRDTHLKNNHLLEKIGAEGKFEDKFDSLMNQNFRSISPEQLLEHILQCKEKLREINMAFEEGAELKRFLCEKNVDHFLQHCEIVIDYANLDKSNLKILRHAKDMENQLEQLTRKSLKKFAY